MALREPSFLSIHFGFSLKYLYSLSKCLIFQTVPRLPITHYFRNHGPSVQHGRGGGRVWHYDGIQGFRAGRAGLAHGKMHTTASRSHIGTVHKIEFCNTWKKGLPGPCLSNRVTLLFSQLMHHVSLHVSLNVLTLRGLIWSKRPFARNQPKDFLDHQEKSLLEI